MSYSYLSLRVVERTEFDRKWNSLLQELQRRTITVTTPLLLQDGISGGINISMIRQRGGGGAGGGGSPVELEFETVDSGLDEDGNVQITVRGGTIVWHEKVFYIEDKVFLFPAAAATLYFLISLDDEFNPVTPTIESSTTEPLTQYSSPARKTWYLSKVVITMSEDDPPIPELEITVKWRENITWTNVYGMYA